MITLKEWRLIGAYGGVGAATGYHTSHDASVAIMDDYPLPRIPMPFARMPPSYVSQWNVQAAASALLVCDSV